MFGENVSHFCVIKNGPKLNDVIEVIYSSGVCMTTIVYCFVVGFLVIVKLRRVRVPLVSAEASACDAREVVYSVVGLKTVVSRTCMYPAACFLSYFGYNVLMVHLFLFKGAPRVLFAWAFLGCDSRGILHLVAFFADPLVAKALPDIFGPPSRADTIPDNRWDTSKPSPTFDVSYDRLVDFTDAESPSPCLRSGMLKEFQRYV